jgi:hypothetical protein
LTGSPDGFKIFFDERGARARAERKAVAFDPQNLLRIMPAKG